ncbi:hypothetical protein G6F37_009453 [Rhizopus arrhizus]|nr:hypothetical protein G6F38_006756 [Rhizopus arrhizus]KAG1154438.1 hypothetical protein G6F37_009453 [Rhizopus arrhizus]
MLVTITTDGEEIYNLEIDSQMAIEDLKALLEAESGVAPAAQRLFYHGKELVEPKKTLEEYYVGHNEVIHMQRIVQASSSHPDFDAMRQHVLMDQRLLQQLERTNPELANAARHDPAKFSAMVEQIEQSRRTAEFQKAQLAALNDDPFDVEAQKRIEDAIRQENIAANLEAAMEYNPESFARVTRLYINVEINNKKLVALVDSGAQSTVISPETAEACGLMRLLDTRFSGVAKGVHGSEEDEVPSPDTKVTIPAAAESAGASSTQKSSTTNTQSRFSEKDIKLLTDMGVSRQEAIQALEMAEGNPDLAASLLF